MSRLTRSRLLAALLVFAALGVVSCFQDLGDCPTCPPVDSGRSDVIVPKAGLVDSIHVRLDGGTQVTVRRGFGLSYTGLSVGDHEVTITRWFFIEGLLTSRTSSLRVRLGRGESRTIIFHNDFPLVAGGPAPDADRARGSRHPGPIARRLG